MESQKPDKSRLRDSENLLDGKGALLEGKMVQTTSEMLKNAIGESLRKGDLFTCYSPSQYLILLSGADQEECQNIFQRIEQNLRCWEDWRRIRLKYEVLSQV